MLWYPVTKSKAEFEKEHDTDHEEEERQKVETTLDALSSLVQEEDFRLSTPAFYCAGPRRR